jgi:plasmid stability protein
MANITVRNIPRVVHATLRRSARQHGRSLNAEIVGILDGEARRVARRLEKGDLVAQLRRLREEVARKFPVNYESADLIREDRDQR